MVDVDGSSHSFGSIVHEEVINTVMVDVYGSGHSFGPIVRVEEVADTIMALFISLLRHTRLLSRHAPSSSPKP